ncbi:PilZ domain-containing protein [Motiliproteus coralliicola]|uniref:PilZ domain-containing protein n=1 Tax=Motiliproteus coralliicola TaxID=2283196 RepID=A0A369WVA7_9GAMM|nr:PilZ domain-containing protein [Motiliproteus coralliicola]RDE24484.1 PilZ domain-containing protein [Motiliproteus coralliicola]
MVEQFPEGSDQRRSFRYPVALQALVINEQQDQSPALVTNISRDGLRLEGDRLLVEQVFPNYRQHRGLRQQQLELHMALNEGQALSTDNAIRLVCTSVYVLRLTKKRYQIGVCFRHIDEDYRSKLEQLIAQLEAVHTLEEIRQSRHPSSENS